MVGQNRAPMNERSQPAVADVDSGHGWRPKSHGECEMAATSATRGRRVLPIIQCETNLAETAVSTASEGRLQGIPGCSWHHRRHVAPERGDLLDQARAHEPVLDRGHEEDRVDLRCEHTIVVRELHLDVEIA